jgi:hypothetical protein
MRYKHDRDNTLPVLAVPVSIHIADPGPVGWLIASLDIVPSRRFSPDPPFLQKKLHKEWSMPRCSFCDTRNAAAAAVAVAEWQPF